MAAATSRRRQRLRCSTCGRKFATPQHWSYCSKRCELARGWKGPSADEARMLELLSRLERMGPVEQREALAEVARLKVALRLGGADG